MSQKHALHFLSVWLLSCWAIPIHAAELFIEAESFEDRGGWKLDTQFIQQMGSPYLLAHGLGKPVEDATTTVQVTEPGTYRVWVRTFDWVAKWDAKPAPGKFKLQVDDQQLDETFGTKSDRWHWHDGGTIELGNGSQTMTLRDLTGFNGRCDCIFLTTDLEMTPPDVNDVLSPWRRSQLGLPGQPDVKGDYDLVVIGGGYAGMGAAISAARMGCKVALIQDRGVLGGNGSSEVRVWAMGNIRRGKFPRVGEIIEEFADSASKSPGRYEEFGDDVKEEIVRAESNIDLMLNHHAYAVDMTDESTIGGVRVLNTITGEDLRVTGRLFSDCTGHGWIGEWARADHDTTPDGRMGMSNMWVWDNADSPQSFPKTPWALDLNMADFPYPRDFHGQWFWESGFGKDPIGEAESIRDWNLRAVYGAFNAMKNRDGANEHADAILTWIAFVGGPRESRRLMGDVLLTEDDIVAKREFPDGCVPSTWSIDLHYPKEQYAKKFPENPFISVAVHDRRVDRMYGYPVPYRCFYSRNVSNLFMAGRCISVTHEALGTVRVMKTCGMMGEVVGKAASICTIYGCSPRDVYAAHLPELLELLQLPGKARRSSPGTEVTIPDDALPLAGPFGVMPGVDPEKMTGIVIDDRDATFTGDWKESTGLKGYVGWSYQYAAQTRTDTPTATATFTTTLPKAGKYLLQVHNAGNSSRGTKVPVTVSVSGNERQTIRINQREMVAGEPLDVGEFFLPAGEEISVTFGNHQSEGTVHVDAVGWVAK